MTESNVKDGITLDAVMNLLAENGYEASGGGEDCLVVKDPESGVTFTCVLEDDILFNTVPCIELDDAAITAELMKRLLDAENGISTSSFQIYHPGSGKAVVSLNNFCKLQDLGPEDQDDILSCLQFLNVDVLVARNLFGEVF